MKTLLSIGPLRIGLACIVLLLIVAAFFADGKVYMHDWRLLPGVVAPSIVMMILFVLPLDITMSFVFMSDAEESQRTRLKRVVVIDIMLFLGLIVAWLPFMLTVLSIDIFG